MEKDLAELLLLDQQRRIEELTLLLDQRRRIEELTLQLETERAKNKELTRQASAALSVPLRKCRAD